MGLKASIKMFPSSILNKKIEFITKEVSLDEYNTPEEEREVRQFYVWANMYVRSGSRDFGDYGANISNIVEWKMRYQDDITPDMSIKYNGYYYRIDFIEELGNKDGLRIETKVTKFDQL